MIDLRYELSGNIHLGDWRVNGMAQTPASRNAAPATVNGFGTGATADECLHSKLRRHLRRSAADRVSRGGRRIGRFSSTRWGFLAPAAGIWNQAALNASLPERATRRTQPRTVLGLD